ncbi:NUP82 [Candida oxycetoniae]|uniref:NUP82 n=1 Tax=Candida oxycetoniae TaxID=497107 RepID=A0AAI9SYA6_9ASCO|nr:NUP82 [Candida oxycetoniae]KAI3404965.2 NUP82 [Candida oxycetoniae]
MNESSTLLAVVGESNVDIVVLPTPHLETQQSSAYVDTTSYRVQIPGKIRKCIWQSICANDSMFVVLNDNSEIFGFDILKSTKIPQIRIKIENEKINSITFGSRSKIGDGLRIFASTDDKIFALNFYHKGTKIAVSEGAVDLAIVDSQTVISLIIDKFGDDPKNSYLLRSALEQLNLYKSFKNQLRHNVREVRGTGSDEPYELFKVDLNFLNSSQIDYSPNTVANFGADDLISFGGNEQVTLLAMIKNNTISYFINILDCGFIKHEEPAGANYTKPKKGFGFVDTFDEVNAENIFWENELCVLDYLQSDKLPAKGGGGGGACILQNINNCDNKFVAVIDSDIVVVDCAWVEDFLSELQNDVKYDFSPHKIRPTYNLLSSGDDLQGFAFVNKFQQEIVIVVREQLELVKLTTEPEEEKKLIAAGDQPKTKDSSRIVPQSQLDTTTLFTEPFAEIEEYLRKLKVSTIVSSTKATNLNPAIENLEELNKISQVTNSIISNYTVFAVKLQSRVITQLQSVKLQFERLQSISSIKPYNEKHSDRICKLFERQKQLDLKMKVIQDKISDQFYKAKDLPLSVAEKKYFEEINTCNKTSKELVRKLDEYKEQVERINKEKEKLSTNKEEEKKEENEQVLQTLQLEQKVKRLIVWLKSQDADINDMMKKVKIAVQ